MPTLPLLLLSLTVGLSLSSPAHAARKKAREDRAASVPLEPGDGSLWDGIDDPDATAARISPKDATAGTSVWDAIEDLDGLPPTPETIAASEELEAARSSEHTLVDDRVRQIDNAVDFYTDPVGSLAHDPLFLDQIDPSEFDIPMVVNDDVIRWLKYFTGNGRKWYTRWLERSTAYHPMMKEKLRAAGLPEDLVYLSMIESGYSANAYSHAGAAGLWQFIPATGRRYKLRIDSWVDERRDPERSTDAAVAHLADLNRDLGHWYLAWAGYNAGAGRVTKGFDRYGTRDFWELVEKNAFASETDNYVPKLLAAAIIGKHPERYGFTSLSYEPVLSRDTVLADGSVSLDVLAKCAGVSTEELQALNPHLRQWALPPEKTTVHVPRGRGDDFLASLAQIPQDKRLTYHEHRVASGETLGTIAKRYGASVADVQSYNHISNPNLIRVGQTLIIPAGGKGAAPPPVALASTAGSGTSKPKATSATHTVQKGETLSAVASRYGVSTSDLLRWNGLSNANHITVGQKLKLYTSSSSWTSYTVRKGDALSTIASKNGCSVSDLQSWNNLRGTSIYAGQTLKIKK